MLCIPKKARESIRDIDNNYLLYNRFLYDYVVGKGSVETTYSRKGTIVKCDYGDLFRSVSESIEKTAKNFPAYISYKFIPHDKIAVGMSCDPPTITLHPVYGMPYIPASAIKGVIRNCYIQNNFTGSEEDALKDAVFVKFFGASVQESNLGFAHEKLIFLDAFPCKEFEIYWDVQTPHFKYYYNEAKKPPTDTMDPVPLRFPIVKNTEFKIYICSYDTSCDFNSIDRIIKEAFEKYGIGAKTALGYGLGKIASE